jgi:lipopolysaccharide biosynthesis regulator YciM
MASRGNTGEDLAKAQILLRQGQALLQSRRGDEALKVFGQAVREHRWQPAVLIEAARAYVLLRSPHRAAPLLARACKLGDQRIDILMSSGECYRRMGDFRSAEGCFRRCLRLVETYPLAELELAHICERTHRLDEAAEFCDRLLRRHPDHGAARIIRARVFRRQQNISSAVDLLKDWAIKAEDSNLSAEGWGELALAYDESADYEAAWQAILQTKRILLARNAPHNAAAEHVSNRFEQFVKELTPQQVQSWKSDMVQEHGISHGSALLTGFPRSGTTLLEQMLDEHPQIKSLEEKDLLAADVFTFLSRTSHTEPISALLLRLSEDDLRRARSKYLTGAQSYVGEISAEQIFLDKNPALTLMIPIYLRLFPEGKIIFALRDPRDVILSCFLRYLPLNPVSVHMLTLERLVKFYELNMRGWLRFRELFPGCFTEIRYENTVHTPEQSARACLELLNLPWQPSVLAYRSNVRDRAVLSPTYDAVAKPIYATSVGRWQNYAHYLQPVQERLDLIAQELGYSTDSSSIKGVPE